MLQSIGWLYYWNVIKLSFASEQMCVAQLSQFPRLLSSNDSDRQWGGAVSITVAISAIQFHTPDVDTYEMSNSRRSPSLIMISVGIVLHKY